MVMIPEVKAFFDQRTQTLTYVVFDPQTHDAVVIDPVLDYEPVGSFTFTESSDLVTAFVRERELRLHYVLETHAHADHLSGSQLLARRFGARVAIGRRITEVQATFKHIFDLPATFATDGSQFDRLLDEGVVLPAGSLSIGALATPGHTPACLSYLIGDAVFTGDALFMDDYGTGRCDFPKGSADALFDSVQKLYRLPDATRVFVGHDYQPGGREPRWQTTIGDSKRRNVQLNERTTRAEFVSFRQRRDAQLAAPRLLFQSVQVNADAGRLPPPHENGVRYLRLPLNFLRPANELGEPLPPPSGSARADSLKPRPA
jgi:glyoxylase-like metal-dependent hydrolase (beta-lactamase superfamily II)